MWLSVSSSSFEELKDLELGELPPVLHGGLEVGLASGRADVRFPLLVLGYVLRDGSLPWDTGIDLNSERLLWLVNVSLILASLNFWSILSVLTILSILRFLSITLSRSLVGVVRAFALVGVRVRALLAACRESDAAAMLVLLRVGHLDGTEVRNGQGLASLRLALLLLLGVLLLVLVDDLVAFLDLHLDAIEGLGGHRGRVSVRPLAALALLSLLECNEFATILFIAVLRLILLQ